MVKNTLMHKFFWQPMMWTMHTMSQIFVWGVDGGVLDFFPQCIPIKFLGFSTSSLSSQIFPRHVPNITSFCPICYAQCCVLGSFLVGQILELICFYVWNEYFYIVKFSDFQKNSWWTIQKGSYIYFNFLWVAS